MDYKEAAALLGRWNNLLILTHKRPDGDTIGCAVGLCALLRQVGKTAWVLPNEDATSLFTGYLSGYLAPGDFVPDKVVAVDIASLGLFPAGAEAYKDRVDLAIDHHPSHEDFARCNCVEPDKAACGEIIFKLVSELGTLDREIATALYLAVSTDTGCFVYSNTTPNTHRVAARLMEEDIPYRAINKRHFRTKSFKRLKLESALVEGMETLEGGKVVLSDLSLETMARLGATEEDAEDIAAFLGQIEGVLVSVTIREMAPGECKISVRSDPAYLDASATCAKLGGGGHRAAAGCTVYGSVAEARDVMKKTILETLRSDA